MNITVESFDEFVSGAFDYDEATGKHTTLHLVNKAADVGGGTLTVEDIDVLKDYPTLDVVMVTGLHQDTFEYFVKTYGKQFRAIRFFKNRLVSDWSLLGELPQLEFVYFFANQRIGSLWDMSENHALRGLAIEDFSKLHSIEGIEKAPALRTFEIGNAVWSTATIESFAPLAGTDLEHLGFTGKRIEDDDLSFLREMPNLKRFDFASNLFTTEQVAWIVANMPQLSGDSLCAKIDFTAFNDETGEDDVPATVIVGKRKPMLVNSGNEAKILRYTENFERLVEGFKGKEQPRLCRK